MTELPESWEASTVDDVATVQLGRQRSPKNHTGPHMRPYLRSANVTWRGIDVVDVKEMNFEPSEATTFELNEGDILLNEASGSPGEVGKPAIWRNEIPGACFQNTLLRVRSAEMDGGYLYWYFYNAAVTGRFGEAGRGVNIRHLGKKGLTSFPIPVPPHPEQRRIVAAIEEHLSRLDAATEQLGAARSRQPWLNRAATDRLLESVNAPSITIGEALKILSGRAFPSGAYCDSGVLLVRPGNLDPSGSLAWSSKATRHLPKRFAEEHPKVLLTGKRLLMNLTAQSLADEFLGRVCLSGEHDRFLLNQRIADLSSTAYLPDFLYFVFRSSRFRRFVDSLNAGSLIQHISTKQLAQFELPKVSLDLQRTIVSELRATHETSAAGLRLAEGALDRAEPLRRSILSAAFSGQLVPQDPSDQPASVLLERIAVERAVQKPSRSKKKAAS